MADDRTRRSTSPVSSPAPQGGAAKDGPRTVISKRPVPQPEVIPPLGNSVQELGQGLVGKRLGHFQLETFVGGGGMGAVFRGTDLKLGRTVAIKVLSKDRTDDDTVRRFQNEAQSAARLDHPNIARVYYVGEDLGWNYIVFEYIEGLNIRDLVEQRGPLPLDEALPYVLQVAEALDHASRRDVVHRDIKPSNVLVMPDGKVKLVDMGLARLHQVEASNADLTATGVTLGTFDYISPEQARDPRSADVRSDLYSLGCTLFFMLTGQPPFPGGTVLQKLLSHSSDPPPDVRIFRPDIGEETSDILERLLAKQPAQRYQTPSELIGALLLLADDLGLRGVAPSSQVVVAPTTSAALVQRQIPWLVPVALLFVIAMVLQFVWSQTPEYSPERMRPAYAGPRDLAVGPPTPAEASPSGAPSITTPADPDDGTKEPRPSGTSDSNEPGDDAGNGSKGTTSSSNRDVEVAGKPSIPKPPTAKPTGDEGNATTTPASSPGAPGAAGSPPPATGPARRVIVSSDDLTGMLDASSRQAETFQEAMDLAQLEPQVDVIELRWQGERTSEDFEMNLSGRRLTVRAAAGFKPILTFQPPMGETPRDRRMLRIAQANLSWERVDLLFVLPAEPYDDWALFSLDRSSSLELTDCIVTVRNAGPNGQSVNRVACVEWSRSLSPEMTSAERSTRPGPPPLLALRNSIVRGQVSLVQALDNIPFRLTWSQGLFASTEHLIIARGASEQPAVTDGLHLELQNVTVAVGNALCQMRMDADHRFPWTCVCRLVNCILLKSSGASVDSSQPLVLVEQQFAAPAEPLRKRPFISGAGNYYPADTVLFKVDAAGFAQESIAYSLLDRDRARDEKWYDEQPALGMVMWLKLPVDQPVDAQTQRDYVLDTTPQNPARTAGFDPMVLPDPEPNGGSVRDKPSSPPATGSQ